MKHVELLISSLFVLGLTICFIIMLRRHFCLHVTERNLLSYRRSLLISGIDWTASRIPLCYLDPAVTNEKLSKIHLDKLFPRNAKLEGDLLTFVKVRRIKQRRRRWFSLDDSSVGCDDRGSGIIEKKDYLGMELFYRFAKNIKDKSKLQQGVIRFLNMFSIFGVKEWNNSESYEYYQLDGIFDETYPSVLKGIFEKKSEHPLLVVKLWDTVCLSDYTRTALFTDTVHKDHLEFMLKVANTTRFDFWGMRRDGENNIQDIIFDYLRSDRCDWISLLIDYGFNILPGLIREAFDGYRVILFSKHKHLSLSNIHMMWYLATFCWKEDVPRVPGFFDMFRKLFRSLLLPTLPHAVVRKCLQLMFPEAPKVVDAQIEHFYECGVIHPIRCEEEVQPKLSHLCRRVVRERLARNFQLPAGIDALNVPIFIKRFLRLEF